MKPKLFHPPKREEKIILRMNLQKGITNTKLIGTDLTEVKYDQTMEVNGAKFINNPGISEELESFLIEKGARKGYI